MLPPKDMAALQKWAIANLNPARLNAFVAHVNRLMSTPGGIDKVLTALSYALTLVAPQVARVSSALGGGRRRQRLLPSTFPPPSPSGLPARLRALSALISDVRTFMRLWGLFSIWEWGVTTLRMPRGTDVVARRIVLAQVGVNAFFQACENAAYLSRHAVVALPGGKATERRLWAWSSRAWAAHIALEFWRLERERRIRNERRRRGRAPVQARQLELSEEEAWTRGWVVNAANAPLSLHWSTESGILADTAVGALGSTGAFLALREAWRKTA